MIMVAFHQGMGRDISKLLHKDYWTDRVKGHGTAPSYADLTAVDVVTKKRLMEFVNNIICFPRFHYVIYLDLCLIALSSE